MEPIKLTDTLTRSLKQLEPSEPGTVKMYVCGPTVYDSTHIGHGRTYVVYDALKRYLSLRGYNVIHVMNITDIDDKIIRRSQEEGRDWRDIVDYYIKDYFEALGHLGVKVDNHPRVTEHIRDIIHFIEVLIEKGHAYVAPSGSVYFDVDTYGDYGRLSNRIDKQLWSQEAEFVHEKKKPYDFALWKAAKPGEPYWESPWGKGRPGWHIECSVMSSRILGSRIDIHGGGTDLIFPHHENERAQSESYFGTSGWVSIWMHTGMLMIGKEKMSKSLHNIIPIKDAVKKWGGKPLRLYYLMHHYRKPMEFTEEGIESARSLYEKLVQVSEILRRASKEPVDLHYVKDEDLKLLGDLLRIRKKFHEALSNDFNTPEAMAAVNEFISFVFRDIQYRPSYILVTNSIKFLREADAVLGVLEEQLEATSTEYEELFNNVMKILIDVRAELRKRGLYELSDNIRSELNKLGIVLMDKGLETTWVKVKK